VGLSAVKSAAPISALTPAPASLQRAPSFYAAPALEGKKPCDCGAPSGFSGRCAPCEGLSLSPSPVKPGMGTLSASPAPSAFEAVAEKKTPPPALSPIRLQKQLRVSAPADAAEIEAEEIGRRVSQMAEPVRTPPSLRRAGRSTVQRRAIQPSFASAPVVRSIEASRSAGAPLPRPVRSFMEPRFGADFSNVRVHTGQEAAVISTQLNAHAFTTGRDIFFNEGQFRPDSDSGRELIAHELAHTIQQGGTIQRAAMDTNVAERTGESVQRGVWDTIKSGVSGIVNALGDPLQFLADKANMIPGFRMFTIVIGANPITMAKVDPSPANILMALIEFIPGGGLVTQALQNSGVFDKVGNWIAEKVKALVSTAAAIKAAVTTFINSLSVKDIADPGGVWQRAKAIFSAPIDRVIAFCKGVITDILKFIKDAILIPLAKLAEGTDAWPLLLAVLGKNPITDEKVDPKPDVLIGGFMKLIGQEEVWKNMQEAKAVDRAFAWFKGAVSAVKGFVSAIPGKFMELFTSLTIEDVVLVAGAFKKVVSVFGGFVGNFISWGLKAVFDLLEIIFDVVSPGAFAYVKKTAAALKDILKNPLPFVKNLIAAGKLGLNNFLSNFVDHLKSSLVEWLLGAVPGVYLPKALSLIEFGKFVISILGLSWQQIRGKIVKALGKNGETIMKGLELAFDVIKILINGGLPALWEFIKEKLTNLKDMAVEAIVGFVKSAIIEKAVPKLISMFIPGAGFIGAIVSIWDTIKVIVEKIATITAVVKSYVDSIVAIAQGDIGGAASRVEGGFKSMLTLAISFFAGFVGLGGIPGKIKGAIEGLREQIDKGLEFAVNWVIGKAKALFASLFGGKDDKDGKPRGGEIGDNPAFSATDGSHHLWVDPRGGSPVVMLASTAKPLTAYLAEFQQDAKDSGDTDTLKLINQAGGVAAKIERDAARAATLPIDTPARTTLDNGIKANEAIVRPLLGQILDIMGKSAPDRIKNAIPVKFSIKSGLDPVEYDRQLKAQESAINEMMVQDWITNRMRFAERGAAGSGRDPAAAQTQRDYRVAQRALVVERLQKPMAYSGPAASAIKDEFLIQAIQNRFGEASKSTQATGFAASTAERITDSWMAHLAALHSPDQVAGGENVISGLGYRDVNADIGQNWGGVFGKPRALANDLQTNVEAAMKEMKVRHAFWRQVKMNVNLTI
jgi:Domain of unknown function (DUF4157)/Novel toxin 15